MAIDYEAAQKSFRKHKANLTRAKNSGDPHKVVAAVDKAFGEWDDMGIPYPDSWHTWNVAKEDAQHQIRMSGNFNDRRPLADDVSTMQKLRVRNAARPGVRGT